MVPVEALIVNPAGAEVKFPPVVPVSDTLADAIEPQYGVPT